MIDVFGEQRGGTCALLLQSRLGGGRRLFHPHSDPESVTRRKRNNNSWWFVSQTIAGKLGAFRRVTISSLSGGLFMRGAPRVPLLIRLGAFDAHCRFLLLLLAVQEWPESKAAIQIRFHLNQLEEKEREREGTQNRERERRFVNLPPPKSRKSYQEKRRSVGVERGAEESRGISEDIFFSLLLHISLPSSSRSRLKVAGEAAETAVKDGRAASLDALPRGRHGRTPRPGAAYAGWHGGDGRRGKKAGHRRHTTANHDHHRPKLGRGTGEVSPRE